MDTTKYLTNIKLMVSLTHFVYDEARRNDIIKHIEQISLMSDNAIQIFIDGLNSSSMINPLFISESTANAHIEISQIKQKNIFWNIIKELFPPEPYTDGIFGKPPVFDILVTRKKLEDFYMFIKTWKMPNFTIIKKFHNLSTFTKIESGLFLLIINDPYNATPIITDAFVEKLMFII
jgi:hypothetical protein